MKIKTDEPSSIVTEQARKSPKRNAAAHFDELLQRTIDRARLHVQKSEPPQGSLRNIRAAEVGPASSVRAQDIGSVDAVISPDLNEQQHGPVLRRVEQLLDTLEEYQRNLGNASTSADSLVPLIGRMEEQNKSLAAVLVTLPDGDDLKEILNRVLITSVVEVEKFKRGDYS